MLTWLSLLFLSAGSAQNEPAEECADTELGVCLLQGRLRSGAHALPMTAAGSCPGPNAKKSTVRDTCQCTGVLPSDISSKEADNFDIKRTSFYVTGVEIPHIEAHPFSEGVTNVLAVHTDYANLQDRCVREVHCADDEPPEWKYSLVLNDPAFELHVDAKCELSLHTALSDYAKLEGNSEEGGFAKAATDNCNIKTSTLMVYSQREGKTVYDGDVNSVPVELNVFGPGLYDFKFTATDTAGLTITHDTVLLVHDRLPPTARLCPKNMMTVVSEGVTSSVQEWDPPRVTADNCLPAGLMPSGMDLEGVCEPPSGTAFPLGTTAVKCHVTDRLELNRKQYTAGTLHVNTIPCAFTITVRQHVKDPVTITCPADITDRVYEDAAFGVPAFAKATASHKGDDAVEITYHNRAGNAQLVEGMPFQFGTTTVIARASASAGYNDEQYWLAHTVECAFNVTIIDVHNPLSDGGKFRCHMPKSGSMKDNPGYEPYTVCDGTGLEYKRADGFADTLEYDITSLMHRSLPKSGPACCMDEKGGQYKCGKHKQSDTFSYCQPDPSAPAPDPIPVGSTGAVEDPPGDGKIGNPACKNRGGGMCLSPTFLLQLDEEEASEPMKSFTASSCDACKDECKRLRDCQWYSYCPKQNPSCKSMPDVCRLWSDCIPPRNLR